MSAEIIKISDAIREETPSDKKKASPEPATAGIQLRTGKLGQSIRICFRYEGVECRETIKRDHSPTGIKYATKRRAEILGAIESGRFVYEEFFPNSTRAKTKAIETEAAAYIAAEIESSKVVITVGDLLREYLISVKRTRELSTYNCYAQNAKTHIYKRWDKTPINELTSADLRKWILSIPAMKKTIDLMLTPFRGAVEQAYLDKIISENPFATVKTNKILSKAQRKSKNVTDPFNIDEMENILAACDRDQDRNMFQFAFGTGMRPCEYIALGWNSVKIDRNFVRVANTFVDGAGKDTAKTDLGIRNIDLRVLALGALVAQKRHTETQGGLVFINQGTGEAWTGDKQVRERWRRILKIAEVRYRRPYQTRHTFASSLLMLGVSALYVAAQLGHTDTTMVTKTYGKWIEEGITGDKRARLEALYVQIASKQANEFSVRT